MLSFEDLHINNNIVSGLKKQNITAPTPIQEKVIPLALENKDVIGESQTGSGKTLAYLLPLFQKVDSSKREMQAVILAPTHELAMQIEHEITLLAENSEIAVRSAAVIGEANINRQIEKLKEKPHIIVGSSGRVLELIKRKKLSAHTIKTIVIDEGDKLLDKNNLQTVKDIIKTTLKERQLMVFSASISQQTANIAKELMKDAVVVKVNNKQTINSNINHMYFETEQRDKFILLRKLLAAIDPEKAIIFINKTEETEITTSKLQYHHFNVYGLYGNAPKEERKKAIESFRSGKIQLLVASDIAARGLDIKGVTHIFNLDLPEDLTEYLHRSGRTGRVNESGTSISIVTAREVSAIKKLEREFNISIQKKDIYKGNIVDSK